MSKIKLTKGESKKQRDALAQFSRYLPTLQLKKQQLQLKVRDIRLALADAQLRSRALADDIARWEGLLGERDIDLRPYVLPLRIVTDQQNIAGTVIPVLQDVEFAGADYDYYAMPVWVDRAVENLRAFMKVECERVVLAEQVRRLERELRTTSQRVNLFEKVKIPECQENIRIIRIYLGDQQANSVGISKVAKGKLSLAEGQ